MYRDIISLPEAISYELLGDIVIVDSSPESLPPYPVHGIVWRQSFKSLQSKYRHIPSEKLLKFLSAKYLIEISEGITDTDTSTYSWRYVYGVENSKIKEKSSDNIEYVYILVNPGYPSLIKIGMTVHDVRRRVKGINTTATVEEWVPKFALPVREGMAYRVEQVLHTFFAPYRVSSDRGGSREFFTVDSFLAFDKMKEVGAVFQAGTPIIY
jgi:hypothetical protein